MRIDVGVVTDIGRVREGNEDSYLVQPPLYAVADGMGGHRGGEVASQLALETVEALFRSGSGTLAEQVREANRAVFEMSQLDRKVTGMGTTLTAVAVEGEALNLAHVGDSRAYLLRAGALRQLTKDHTLVGRMVRSGEITKAEAEVHPHRNVITRALGTESDVRVDEESVGLLEGDRVLLCSDGLTSMVTEDQVKAILETTATAQDAADRLVRAANRAGGVDNITVVILDVQEDDEDEAGASESGVRARPAAPSPVDVRRWALAAGLTLLVLVAVFFVGRAYIDNQWYVGEAGGHVAVYQGIPAEPLGLRLSSVDTETDIPIDEATNLELYGTLPEGISANDRDDAFAIVEQIRKDIAGATRGGNPS